MFDVKMDLEKILKNMGEEDEWFIKNYNKAKCS